jgi:hypothetical protein
MNKQLLANQLLAYPLHTSLLVISSLLLVFSGSVKPPALVALPLLATALYTAIFLAQRSGLELGCCGERGNSPSN